jgi:hypothetical protein
MAPKLCDRIFKHLESLGYVKPGSVIVDFMCGTGTTGIIASKHNCEFVGVELEPHFVEMIEGFDCDGKTVFDKLFYVFDCGVESESLVEHEKHVYRRGCLEPPYYVDVDCSGMPKEITRKVFKCGAKESHCKHHVLGNREKCGLALHRKLNWRIIQGDSRRLSELLNDNGVGVVSPPYANQRSESKYDSGYELKFPEGRTQGRSSFRGKYSDDVNNIGNLPDKVAVISPPYADAINTKNDLEQIKNRYERALKAGHTELAERLKKILEGNEIGSNWKQDMRYSVDNNNIGNLPDKVAVISPPYAIRMDGGCTKDGYSHIKPYDCDGKPDAYSHQWPTTRESKQIGNLMEGVDHQDGRETYISAMLQVYQESFKSGLSPLVVVTKNPTRNGALRRLDLDTIALLEKAGYEIFDYHRALLFTEQNQATLGGEVKKELKGRLSFFKYLSYKKGNIVANFEDIIFAKIP